MEKFGIFDLINKLTEQNKAQNTVTFCKPNNLEKTETSSRHAYKSTVALLKRHDEISKRIDKNNH